MKYLYLLLCGLSLAGPASATHTVMQHVMGTAMPAAQVRLLVEQVTALSRYSMPKGQALPIVDIVPEAIWMREVCPEGSTDDSCSLLGFYQDGDPAEHEVVHVRDGFLWTGREPEAVAVHELVHWFQAHAGWKWAPNDCADVAAHEMEAYGVEYMNDLAMGRLRPFWMPEILGQCLGFTHR